MSRNERMHVLRSMNIQPCEGVDGDSEEPRLSRRPHIHSTRLSCGVVLCSPQSVRSNPKSTKLGKRVDQRQKGTVQREQSERHQAGAQVNDA